MIGSEEFHPFSASPRPTQDSYSQQLNLYALPKMIEPQKCALKGRSARLKWTRMDGQSGGEGDSSRYLSLNTFLFSLPSRKKSTVKTSTAHMDRAWTVFSVVCLGCVWSCLSTSPSCGIQLRSTSDGTVRAVGSQEFLLSS